ncbi:MAG: B12-binding domain-containing radical SAM protein [Clostridiales bacterium 43-6]|nr:MAG: B12-binding domain-containing radical SAM protein [Clostridiales bacterium 43-6]
MTDLEFSKLVENVQKPGRYAGGELNSVLKDKQQIAVRFAFCFPDIYEIGMSHLGMKILYSLLNELDYCWCERVFAPFTDMEASLRENNRALFAIESRDDLSEFDIIGFTLQYELSYTNILNMLALGNVLLLSADRAGLHQLVIAGGPCACNPEPLCDFVDLFVLGEGEEVTAELVSLYRQHKLNASTKDEFLAAAAAIEGVYVPSLYLVKYREDFSVESVAPRDSAPAKVRKRIIKNLDKVFYPDRFVVPYMEIVHDRVIQEIFRGCIRGCRFCQAGMIYRPVREKNLDIVSQQAKCLCDTTGYDEVSLSSLSTSDYSALEPLVDKLLSWSEQDKVSISLPSLRIDSFSPQLLDKISKVRKSGLTFAPEAGTQRMRNVINKNISEEEIINTCKTAFAGGYINIKLYFMMGLPYETMEDIEGIIDLSQRVVDLYYQNPDKPKGKSVQVSISVSTFVPKPFTPFQWAAFDSAESIKAKQQHLLSYTKSKKIKISFSDKETSFLEAVLARGDRRLGAVLLKAFSLGCKMDGWDEFLDFEKWMEAFAACGVDPLFYLRKREYDERLPWDHLDYYVTKGFLQREDEKAAMEAVTENCRQRCSGCGADQGGGCSFEKR